MPDLDLPAVDGNTKRQALTKLIFNISRLGNPASSCEVMATREEGNQQTINVLRCYVDNKKKIQTNVDVFKCHLMTIDYMAMTSRKRIPGLHPPA